MGKCKCSIRLKGTCHIVLPQMKTINKILDDVAPMELVKENHEFSVEWDGNVYPTQKNIDVIMYSLIKTYKDIEKEPENETSIYFTNLKLIEVVKQIKIK